MWLLLMAATSLLSAQQVDSIMWTLQNTSLTITYQLDQQADIRVRVSIDGGHTYSEPLVDVHGDVGPAVAPGRDKKITAEDLPEISGIEEWLIDFIVEVDDGSAIIWFDTIPIVMMPVSGGTFTMGLTHERSNAHDPERSLPAHEVTLSDFYIGRFEVTQQLWNAVMDHNPSIFRGNDSLPVDKVSWSQIQIFIARLSQLTGYRFHLPTEAQWEYAARGGHRGSGHLYPGTSDNLFAYAWYCGNSGNVTHPVGRLLPNELGLYDMGGNVAEWCSDWAGNYTADHQADPRGPRQG
ncbi:MAG: formylglycine-generating enzyme family protein, partial [Bacteroidales bacterium]|nr:formylglycine-generating enzyme family protein [Bacteroidales bacterium]